MTGEFGDLRKSGRTTTQVAAATDFVHWWPITQRAGMDTDS